MDFALCSLDDAPLRAGASESEFGLMSVKHPRWRAAESLVRLAARPSWLGRAARVALLRVLARLDLPHASIWAMDILAEAGAFPVAQEVIETGLRSTLRHRRYALREHAAPAHFSQTGAPVSAVVTAVLARAVEVLQAAGARPFLAYGTLLGFAREGTFVAGDRDIDLGVFADEVGVTAVLAGLREAGFTVTAETPVAWPSVIKACAPGGVEVDVVFFKRRPEGLVTHTTRWGQDVLRVRTPFALRRERFCGVDVWVPDPPEIFLDENYGNWHVPTEFFHYLISPEIPTDFSQPAVALTARMVLKVQLQNGNRAAIRSCLAALLRKDPHETLWPEVYAGIQSRYPDFCL